VSGEDDEVVFEEVPIDKLVSEEQTLNEIWKYSIVHSNYKSCPKNSIARNVLFIQYEYLHEIRDPSPEDPTGKNSIIDTAKAVFETVQAHA